VTYKFSFRNVEPKWKTAGILYFTFKTGIYTGEWNKLLESPNGELCKHVTVRENICVSNFEWCGWSAGRSPRVTLFLGEGSPLCELATVQAGSRSGLLGHFHKGVGWARTLIALTLFFFARSWLLRSVGLKRAAPGIRNPRV